MVREYEMMFIFDEQEAIFQSSLEKVKAFFSENSVEITSEEDKGVKQLAYEIGKKKRGHFWLFKANIESTSIKALDKELRLFEDLLKYMFVKIEYIHDRYADKKAG